MAAETTTSTLDDLTQSVWIEPMWLDYAWDFIVATQFFRRFSLEGKPSDTLQLPRITSNMTVNDRGASVDTEFAGAEATALSNTALTSESVTCQVAEYALLNLISDNVDEDSVNGFDVVNTAVMNAARIMMTAVEDDAIALFAGLSNNVGSSGNDLTIAQTLAAQVGILKRGTHAPDGAVYVLDHEQADNLEAAIIATSTSMASYAGATDRLLGIDRTANNGMGNGHVLNFRGFPVYRSGLTDTANTGADVVGACFTPSSPGNDGHATFGIVDKRSFRIETQREADARATKVVFSQRVGVAEISDFSGSSITTDAPA